MDIKNIEYSFVHILALETFSELRQTCWEFKAFRGGHVDNTNYGPIPNGILSIILLFIFLLVF